MKCMKCHSPRIIRFLDGFGNNRIFCKTCQESMLLKDVIISQTSITEFNQQNIEQRWKYDGNRKIGSFFASR